MYSRVREHSDHIFDCVCEVAPASDNSPARIVRKLPDTYNDQNVLKVLPNFVFPDINQRNHFCVAHTDALFSADLEEGDDKSWQGAGAHPSNAVQLVSFILTDSWSRWTYGYARYTAQCQHVLVVLSPFAWHDIFFSLLNHICSRALVLSNSGGFKDFSSVTCNRTQVDSLLWSLWHEVYLSSVPEPGSVFTLWSPLPFVVASPPSSPGQGLARSGGGATNKTTFISLHEPFVGHIPFTRKHRLPRVPQDKNLTEYCHALDTQSMIEVFGALLSERRVLMVSSRWDRVSACVQAANTLLYPLVWQHIYVPLLPASMLEYTLAPMPYLIGVCRHTLCTGRGVHYDPANINNQVSSDDGIVCVDVDANRVWVIACADAASVPNRADGSITGHKARSGRKLHHLPTRLVSELRRKLTCADQNSSPKSTNVNNSPLNGDLLARSFLFSIVQIIGHYREALKFPLSLNTIDPPSSCSDNLPNAHINTRSSVSTETNSTAPSIIFDRNVFLNNTPSYLRAFVTELLSSQMFEQFISERLRVLNEGSGFTDPFELCACVYWRNSRTNSNRVSSSKQVMMAARACGTGKRWLAQARKRVPSTLQRNMHNHMVSAINGFSSRIMNNVITKTTSSEALRSTASTYPYLSSECRATGCRLSSVSQESLSSFRSDDILLDSTTSVSSASSLILSKSDSSESISGDQELSTEFFDEMISEMGRVLTCVSDTVNHSSQGLTSTTASIAANESWDLINLDDNIHCITQVFMPSTSSATQHHVSSKSVSSSTIVSPTSPSLICLHEPFDSTNWYGSTNNSIYTSSEIVSQSNSHTKGHRPLCRLNMTQSATIADDLRVRSKNSISKPSFSLSSMRINDVVSSAGTFVTTCVSQASRTCVVTAATPTYATVRKPIPPPIPPKPKLWATFNE